MDLSYYVSGYTVLIETSDEMDYQLLVFKPKVKEEKFPLIIAMHGSGGKEGYLSIWEEEAVRHRTMMLAPLRDGIYRNREEDKSRFYDLIDSIVKKYPIDPNKIYLAGSSSGSIVARWLMAGNPSLFKGVILISHVGVEAWPEELEETDLPPILFVHGGTDPFLDVVQTHVDHLRASGKQVELFVDPEGGHAHQPEWNQKIFDWLDERNLEKNK